MHHIMQNMQQQSASSLLTVPPPAHIAFPQTAAAHFISNPRSGIQLVPYTNTSVPQGRAESKVGEDNAEKGSARKVPPTTPSDETSLGRTAHFRYDLPSLACYPVGDSSHPVDVSLLGSALNSNPSMVGELLRASPPAPARRYLEEPSSGSDQSERVLKKTESGIHATKSLQSSLPRYNTLLEQGKSVGSSSEDSKTGDVYE